MPRIEFEGRIQALLLSLLFCWILMPLQSINVVCEIEFVEIEFMPLETGVTASVHLSLALLDFEFNWRQLGHLEIVALAYGCFLGSLLVVGGLAVKLSF